LIAFIKATTSDSEVKRRQKSPAVVGSGIRSAPQRIEVDLVVASQFEMFHSLAAGEDIECDVEHMVGFVVRQMPLEQMEDAVDFLVELDFLSQQKDGADATGTESPGALGLFVVDIGRGHHRYGPLGSGSIGQAFLNSPSTFLEHSLLACDAFFSDSSTHSKAPLFWNSDDILTITLFQKPAGFSSFFSEILPPELYITHG
jgi:hypothetical protein